MTPLLLIPAFAIINRIRGMDFTGHRIVAAVLAGVAYVTVKNAYVPWENVMNANTVYSYLIVSLGYWLWSSPAWLPRDNWSAATFRQRTPWIDPKSKTPIKMYWIPQWDYWLTWYRWTIVRQLYCIPLFFFINMLNLDWHLSIKIIPYLACSLPILFGWGICYYVASPNCLNLKWHTGWAELLVGGLWGLSLWLTLLISVH